MNKLGFVIAAVVLAAVAFVTSAFVVDQRQIGLVYQFGQIQRVTGDPRLHGRVYFATGGRGIVYGDPQ